MSTEIAQADVLLLSAGFGTRLRPLTANIPKPLLPVAGRPLLDRNLEMVARAGFRRVFINLHYLASQIVDYVGDGSRWGLEVRCVHEPVILDTGGAIRNIEPELQHDALITINSDLVIGPDFCLGSLLEQHRADPAQPMATMVLRPDANPARYGELGVDEQGRLVTFLGESFGLGEPSARMIFIGIQVLSRRIFDYMPPSGSVFSITRHTLKKVLANKGVISSFTYHGYWNDVGTPERLAEASKELPIILGVSRRD